MAVAILRVPNGLDYAQVLGDEAPKHIMESPKTLPSNDSSADLLAKEKNSSIHGSCDSLSRNVSQGNCRINISIGHDTLHHKRDYCFLYKHETAYL